MTQNNPTYYVNAATQAVREGQVPDADFDSGMNAGGSNACGIGIGPAVNIVGTTNQSAYWRHSTWRRFFYST